MARFLYVVGVADAHPNLCFRLGVAGYGLTWSGQADSTAGRRLTVRHSDGVALFPAWDLYRRNRLLVLWAKALRKPVKNAETWIDEAGR